MSSLDHVRALSEGIGPRGSATRKEAEAADYVAEQLVTLGVSPERQTFLSATSAYRPYALAAALALLSLFLFWQPQPVGAAAAALVTAVALASLLLEMQFRPNLLRWLLPIEQSQNVRVIIPCRRPPLQTASDEDAPMGSVAPRAECPATVVITAHLDTHRTPLLFRSPFWLMIFRWLMPAGLGAMAVMLVLFFIGIFIPAPALRLIALAPGLVLIAVFALMVQADLTPYTKGANDNASGVAATLWLAEQLIRAPLQHTQVHLVFTGCEEVGCYGADAYFSANRASLQNAVHIVIDQIAAAGAQPVVVRAERFLMPAHSDAGLLALAEKLIAAHPEWGARVVNLNAGYGELSVGVKHGLRAIAFGSIAPDGLSLHWHQPSDTIDAIDETTLARVQEMVWTLLREIDRQSAPHPPDAPATGSATA
ncbi:MAG: M20/M25/M40 family metallo-hydrolase [Anaerolineae bacterium]